MIRNEKEKNKKENSERWLLTYSDLITLLMIFFVIMYAMSTVDSQKYTQLSSSLNGTFSGTGYIIGEEMPITSPPSSNSDSSTNSDTPTKTQEIKEELQIYLETNNLKGKVDMSVEPRGLVITLKENVFFESGSATLLPAYEENILEISQILEQLNNDIVVEGYTDNRPIHTASFSSNWELAAMRAINVIDFLVSKGNIDPSKLSAVSYGEYRPIASNDTEEGRSKNRRIDIVLLSSDFYKESSTEQ